MVINFFVFFCIFGDAVSQTAQTFLPGLLSSWRTAIAPHSPSAASAHPPRPAASESVVAHGSEKGTGEGAASERASASIRLLLRRVLAIGLSLGVLNSALSLGLPAFSPQVTTS